MPPRSKPSAPKGPVPESVVVQDFNREHLQNLERATQTLEAHPLFQNIAAEAPSKISKHAPKNEAGSQATRPL